jgi:hypothetical protein
VLERQLHERIASHIPRDLDTLEHLVLQHKDWETSLHALSNDVDEVQATFRGKRSGLGNPWVRASPGAIWLNDSPKNQFLALSKTLNYNKV